MPLLTRSLRANHEGGKWLIIYHSYQFTSLSTTEATREGVEAIGQAEEERLDGRLVLALSRMHAEFEATCYRLAKALPRNRLRLVFLINNFDLIIGVLTVNELF